MPLSTASMTRSIVIILVMLAMGSFSCSFMANTTSPVPASMSMADLALILNWGWGFGLVSPARASSVTVSVISAVSPSAAIIVVIMQNMSSRTAKNLHLAFMEPSLQRLFHKNYMQAYSRYSRNALLTEQNPCPPASSMSGHSRFYFKTCRRKLSPSTSASRSR